MILPLLLSAMPVSLQASEAGLNCSQIEIAIIAAQKEPVPEPRMATDVRLSAQEALCGGWQIIDVWYSMSGRQSVWRARRRTMNRKGYLTTDLTDAAKCPVLLTTLAGLENVPVSLSVLPRSVAGQMLLPPSVVLDGTSFTLEVRSAEQADRSRAWVKVSSNDGALAQWATSGMKALEPCWRPVPAH